MRLRGFALSELLVAVAIAGLIIGVLTFLNVNYVSLGRRVSELRTPLDLGRHAQAGAVDALCANPGAVLRPGDNKVVAQSIRQSSDFLLLDAQDGQTRVSGALGFAGSSSQPVRIIVESAENPGGSVASIEVGDATVGVVAPRCDLPEVCDYDMTNAMCQADEDTNAAKPS
jgi:type II secretory pathway pseudopilin PulG